MSFSNPTVLLISPLREDYGFFNQLFTQNGWTLHHAPSLVSAAAILRQTSVDVVITAPELPVGTWRDTLELVDLLPTRPLVIVTSLQADDRLWAETLNLGAYDLLAKPFNKTEVVRVLDGALTHELAKSASG